MERAGLPDERPFLCSMKLARRLVPEAPSRRLGTLVHHLFLETPDSSRAHRALDDVLMTVALWNHLTARLRHRLGGGAAGSDRFSRAHGQVQGRRGGVSAKTGRWPGKVTVLSGDAGATH